ncbi:hypothetical protein CSE6_025_40950 [Comamonas sp. E6]|nr:hypothetical protein CSE6_025_40950 [Comamonas sp. E6]
MWRCPIKSAVPSQTHRSSSLLCDNRVMTDESPIHTVHKRVCHTFLRHWKAHNNAYPKLIKMTPEELRQFNIVNSFGKPNELWGVPIEIDPSTTGVMIAVDGTEMPLVEGY